MDNATLNRFYTLHFILPFITAAVIVLHVALLHQYGSTNPLGICSNIDTVPFYPYYVLKDLFGLSVFLFVFGILVFYYPRALGHPDNYIAANALVTPAHIVPEWYFLVFYAILRAIPNKLGGVLAMVASIGILFLVPFLSKPKFTGPVFKPLHCVFF